VTLGQDFSTNVSTHLCLTPPPLSKWAIPAGLNVG